MAFEWAKSTASNPSGNCIEVGGFRKSTHSTGGFRKSTHGTSGACIEAGRPGALGTVKVRDTKQAHLGTSRDVLEFSGVDWTRFIHRVRTS